MSSQNRYISCIKIGGKPILPPLMTASTRDECKEFRRKAIQLERKRERNKIFAQCLQDLTNLQNQTEQLADSQQTTEENKPQDRRLLNLTSETIDVTEYIDEGVRILSDETISTPKPKLLRSNSYTLDSPSPILLAHLEREAAQVSSSLDQSVSLSLSPETVIETPHPHEIDVRIEQVNIVTPINSSQIDKLDPINLEPKLLEVLQQLPSNRIKKILEIFHQEREEHEQQPLSLSITSNQSVYYSVTNTPNENDRVNLNNEKNSGQTSEKREWAATKINAAVRGYLTRRLIKTEKVQSLIDTIKDALMCALELHSAQVIDESDIELHRRLIQQVSAACYAFYDVFFTISTKEQMQMIAVDRQRKLEKALRPRSAASALSSARSNISTNRIKSAQL